MTINDLWKRLKGAFPKSLFALVLLLGSMTLLVWNEWDFSTQRQGLDEGLQEAIFLSEPRFRPGDAGRMIATNGHLEGGRIDDADFNITVDAAIALRRIVQMYQWREVGTDEKRPRYVKVWSTKALKSHSMNRKNPHMVHTTKTFYAKARLGSLTIDEGLLATLETYDPYTADPQLRDSDGVIYRGEDIRHPRIGDVRITYALLKEGPYSVLGVLDDQGRLSHYKASNEVAVGRIIPGTHGPETLIAQVEGQSERTAWTYRIIALLLLFVGLFWSLESFMTTKKRVLWALLLITIIGGTILTLDPPRIPLLNDDTRSDIPFG